MKQFLSKFIGEIAFTLGTGFFIYGIFNFTYHIYGGQERGSIPALLHVTESTNMGAAYFYNGSALLKITIGAILITIGVFLIKNRQQKS
jgi:hypothetical protein